MTTTSESGSKLRKKSKSAPTELWLLLMALVVVGLLVVRARSLHGTMQMAGDQQAELSQAEKVLRLLQGEGRSLDRVDLQSQLYGVGGDRSHFRSEMLALDAMSVGVVQLEDLVKDDTSQTRHAHELETALQTLRLAVAQGETSRRLPEREVQSVRAVLSLMEAEGRTQLEDRTAAFRLAARSSYLYALLFLAAALTLMAALFLLILRDARRQRKLKRSLLAAKDELEGKIREVTVREQESELMADTRDDLQLCTTVAQGHETVVRHMALLLPGTSGAIFQINNSRRMVELAASWGDVAEVQDGFTPEECCGLRAGKPRWRTPGKSELHCLHFAGEPPEHYLCVPLAAHGETLGFVYIGCVTEEACALAERRLPLILEVAELTSMSVASLNLRAKLELQSIRDALTGLFNRHFMEIALERELHRAHRQGTSLAVVMLDVDHFKRLNDTFGHKTGDAVLREVAECFRKTSRQEDVVCRYGGEEFVVIMPDVPIQAAQDRVNEIRASVETMQTYVHGQLISAVTVSAGVAMYPAGGRDGRELLEAADTALYRAKHAGRNRVEMAEIVEA